MAVATARIVTPAQAAGNLTQFERRLGPGRYARGFWLFPILRLQRRLQPAQFIRIHGVPILLLRR